MRRIFPKKEVNFTKLGKIFSLTRQTVSTKFKNLKDLGLIVDFNEEYYMLIKLEDSDATLIPYKTLKVLTDALSENSISAYVYLFNRYWKTEQPFQFTLEQIKRNIGICATTRSNDEVVTNILFVLEKLGLIKYHLTTVKQEADTFENIKTIYQLDWLTHTLNLD